MAVEVQRRQPCPEQYQVDYGSLDPARLSHIRQYPLDGTVVRNIDDNGYYRFAGGAPLVTRCATGAGCVNAPTIDNGTIAAERHQRPDADAPAADPG